MYSCCISKIQYNSVWFLYKSKLKELSVYISVDFLYVYICIFLVMTIQLLLSTHVFEINDDTSTVHGSCAIVVIITAIIIIIDDDDDDNNDDGYRTMRLNYCESGGDVYRSNMKSISASRFCESK